ncbi:MAG: SpoIID/LytB domain-containing protein [Vulcanimicrobiota bacterium]
MLILAVLIVVIPGCNGRVIGENGEKEKQIYDVLIVRSESSLNYWGWKAEQDLEETSLALQRLGVNHGIIDSSELKGREIPAKILILPNTRCMSRDAVEGIKEFVNNGGKLFATSMSGYRDENNYQWSVENNFIFNDIFGADLITWTMGPPRCDALKTVDKDVIYLGKREAILVKPRAGTRILAGWLLSDQNSQMLGDQVAAGVVFNEKTGVIYCGQDLFCQENLNSAQVISYIGILLDTLEPGVVKNQLAGNEGWIPPHVQIPPELVTAVKPGGKSLTIGLKRPLDDAVVLCETPLFITAKTELFSVGEGGSENKVEKFNLSRKTLYRFRGVATQGKAPYINVYDKKGRLVAKGVGPVHVYNPEKANPISVLELQPNGTFRFNCYRGELKFFPADSGRLLVNNYLTMDEYVAGVVPSEMPAIFPGEALKAQAVMARTFAISQVKEARHKLDGYDLCDEIHCQVYKGVAREQLNTDEAVTATSGEVVYYEGKPAFTPFFSTCGGHTADASSAWSGKVPYLVGIYDGPSNVNNNLSKEESFKEFIDNPPQAYCQNAERYRWVRTYRKQELEKMLKGSMGKLMGRDKPMELGTLSTIRVRSRASDGRVQAVEILSSEGVFTVEKDKIRWLTSGGKISTGGLPSTLFYIVDKEGEIIFRGGGWGHAVGMCQEGARGMDLSGKNYKEIIRHYYKGVELIKEY